MFSQRDQEPIGIRNQLGSGTNRDQEPIGIRNQYRHAWMGAWDYWSPKPRRLRLRSWHRRSGWRPKSTRQLGHLTSSSPTRHTGRPDQCCRCDLSRSNRGRNLLRAVRSLGLSVHRDMPHRGRSWWCHTRRSSGEHSGLHHSAGHGNADAQTQSSPCTTTAAYRSFHCHGGRSSTTVRPPPPPAPPTPHPSHPITPHSFPTLRSSDLGLKLG